MQALYQWDLAGTGLRELEAQFRESEEFQRLDEAYFEELLHQVPARLDVIEAALADSIPLPLGQVDPVERAILRLAGYELQSRPDIPYRVVINEAVNLAKKFGAEQAHKFINGALDHAARRLRPLEHARGAPPPSGA